MFHEVCEDIADIVFSKAVNWVCSNCKKKQCMSVIHSGAVFNLEIACNYILAYFYQHLYKVEEGGRNFMFFLFI